MNHRFGATVAEEDCDGVPPDRFVLFWQLIAWAVLALMPCFCVSHATHSPAASTSFLTISEDIRAASDNFPRFVIGLWTNWFVNAYVTLQAPQGGGPAGPSPLAGGPHGGVRGGFLSFLGGVSYRIRILMYFDVSCMYPACILKDTCIPYVS